MVLVSWECAWPEKQRGARCRSVSLDLCAPGVHFSHAWHASQESVVLSDTCFLFEVPLHLSNQHGKEGSQEGSSRSPSPQGDEGKEGIRRSDCQRLIKLLLCCLLGDSVQFCASVLRHTLAVFSRGLYKGRSVVMAGIDLKKKSQHGPDAWLDQRAYSCMI